MDSGVGAGGALHMYFLVQSARKGCHEDFLKRLTGELGLPTAVLRALEGYYDFDLPHKISAICTAFKAAPLRS
jgi:hypothetical protein